MIFKELQDEIRRLDVHERAALAKWLVESLDELSLTEINVLWVEEAERRLEELEQGTIKEMSTAEVLRRARSAIS